MSGDFVDPSIKRELILAFYQNLDCSKEVWKNLRKEGFRSTALLCYTGYKKIPFLSFHSAFLKRLKSLLLSGETLILTEVGIESVKDALDIMNDVKNSEPATFVFLSTTDESKEGKSFLPRKPLSHEGLIKHTISFAKKIAASMPEENTGEPLLERLLSCKRQFDKIYSNLHNVLRLDQSTTLSSEWLLDNAYVIQAQIEDIQRNLPRRFYRELPIVSKGELKGLPRVYALSTELVASTDGRLDQEVIQTFIEAYQSVISLTIGELWALPLLLRLRLVECLENLALKVIQRQRDTQEADFWANRILNAVRRYPEKLYFYLGELSKTMPLPSTHFADRLIDHLSDEKEALVPVRAWLSYKMGDEITNVLMREQRQQMLEQISLSNAILSLQRLSRLDWREIFEAECAVDKILSQEAAGIYKELSFNTRDRYRHELEQLSRQTKISETTLASQVVDLTFEGVQDYEKHVGYYLIDKGLPTLERKCGLKKTVSQKTFGILKGWLPTLLFGTLAFITGLLLWFFPFSLWWIALIPISEISVLLVNYLFTAFSTPQALPKMSFKNGIPDRYRTLVVVPMMLTDSEEVKKELEKLEIRYLGNSDPNLRFALFADFTDAPQMQMPEDQALLEFAIDGIKELNRKNDTEQFFLFHRPRTWNEANQTWMAWERKRGKIEELNRYLMKKSGNGQSENLLFAGNPALLQEIAFVITLDSDTQLLRDKACRLVEVLAHPLNRPVLKPDGMSIERGYTIVQPRVSTSLVLEDSSYFTALFSDPTGTDPYNWAVADLYQDIFHEGIYHGKGIYDLKTFYTILDERYPSGIVLSHDLLEGAYVRTAFAGEMELYDEFPPNYFSYIKRLHRWVRGDWQILNWLFPRVPGPNGQKEKNPLSFVNRWKILDNLRRSLVSLFLFLLLCVSWFNNFFLGTFISALTLLLPALLPPYQWQEFKKKASRALVNVSLLPHQAYVQTDAIVRALYRRYISGRHTLEWERSNQGSTKRKFSAIWWVPAISILIFVALAWSGPHLQLLYALPFLILWALAPFVVHVLNLPHEKSLKKELKPASRQFLRVVARKTWRYFDDFVGPQTNWLPPDNFQEMLNVEVAKRTSSTNIGLYLLTVMSAYDFGYLNPIECIERLEKTMATLAKLELYEGHLLNWYHIETLQPLLPRYVSTVDSGNLIASLWVLQEFLQDLPEQIHADEKMFAGIKDVLSILGDKSHGPQLSKLSTVCNQSHKTHEDGLQEVLKIVRGLDLEGYKDPEERYWIEQLIKQAESWKGFFDRRHEIEAYHQKAKEVADQCKKLADGMNMRFLYNAERRLFSIGYNVNDRRLDNSYYDLLASEARIASFVSIAKGEVPVQHWWALGRPFGRCFGRTVLQSWGGTMFEYLMPCLFMENYENTLLSKACHDAVYCQIEYGRLRGIPWGISESAYSGIDFHRIYQYRAFGVPGLGLKRGLEEDLVVTPYSTGLALMINPEGAVENFIHLDRRYHMEGLYGYYEAIDFSRELNAAGKRGVIIYAYMAHHMAMTLLSIYNLMLDDKMQKLFHRDPRVASSESLLYERISIPTAHSNIHMREISTPPLKPVVPSETGERITYLNTSLPHVMLQANDKYAIMTTNAGSGYSQFENLDVTRWRADTTRDQYGNYIFLRDVERNAFWSSTYAPTYLSTSNYHVEFKADKAKFITRELGIESQKEIIVSPEDNAEVHYLTLANLSMRNRTIEITSYFELALAPHNADRAHPAFSKLFIETEYVQEQKGLLANRRPRSPHEEIHYAFHVCGIEAERTLECQFETSRPRFIGEGRTLIDPAALHSPLSMSQGFVLDPIFSLRRRISIEPGGRIKLSFVTGIAKTRKDALSLMQKYNDLSAAQRAVDMAWTSSELKMRYLHITYESVRIFQQLASRIVFPHQHLRASLELLSKNKLGQAALWAFGISGDLPIVVATIGDLYDIHFIRELLTAHMFWRMQGLKCDLVILNEEHTSYEQKLNDQLVKVVQAQSQLTGLNQPGGVFIYAIDQMKPEDVTLIMATARIIFNASRGSLKQQLSIPIPGSHLSAPLMTGTRYREEPSPPLPFLELLFYNGWGGFTTDAKEYAILLGDEPAPAPWINVIANQNFGSMVSASGALTTWYRNSQTNRLTPWSNDPVINPISDIIYLRSEDSGSFWSITPSPIKELDPYRARHGQGYTIYEHNSHAIEQILQVFVPINHYPKNSVRIQKLTLTNKGTRRSTLSAFAYVEWVLGADKEQSQTQIITSWDVESQSMMAVNPFNPEFPNMVSFLAVTPLPFSYTGDRAEFIGRNGSLASPAALKRLQLSGKSGPGLDPCGALQVMFELDPEERVDAIFLLGQASSIETAREIIAHYRDYGTIDAEFDHMRNHWEKILTKIQIETPDLSTNVLFNRWLLYQNLSCRIWARSAFYQSSGAYGFRDQLQDVGAFIYTSPEITKNHILLAASRQFLEGDVQHWWHPETGMGVRTRVSDDLLWLPYLTALYVKGTQDREILNAQISFLTAPLLEPDQHEVLSVPQVSEEKGSLLDHCCLAIEKALTFGPHGLPLIGGGDWNDGMNWVGAHGKGESVWLAWFLIVVMQEMTPLVSPEIGQRYQRHIKQLVDNIENNAWDGDWYLRAYFDDGTPVGSKQNAEDKIDSIAQSWAVISGVANPVRAKMAMASVNQHLVKREEKLVLLFEPPFNKSEPNPGYIKGYPPGVRENGGQYTHAALWYASALARQKEGGQAVEILKMLNPINHSLHKGGCIRFKLEPYAVAADVYSLEGHVGQGGWNWYTGSAGLMYRVWLEDVCGFKLRGDVLEMDPSIPEDWPSFKIRYHHHENTPYEILIENPNRRQSGVLRVEIDGKEVPHRAIPLARDGQSHFIKIILG